MHIVWLLLGLIGSVPLFAQESARPALTGRLATDANGHLWLAELKDGQIWVSYSVDNGQRFSTAVAATPKPLATSAYVPTSLNLTITDNGDIDVSWIGPSPTAPSDKPKVWFTRSTDHGLSFAPASIVNTNQANITPQLHAMQAAPNGAVTLFWIGQTHVFEGHPSHANSLYYAVSDDSGQTFQSPQTLAAQVMGCGQLATTVQTDGTVAILWRQQDAEHRHDLAMAEIKSHQPPVTAQASFTRAVREECPDQGLALTTGAGFGYHFAYVDANSDKRGLRIARMDNQAWVTSPPKRITEGAVMASQPALNSDGEHVWLAWRSDTSGVMEIWQMDSEDGGRSWNTASKVWRSQDGLGAPQWLKRNGEWQLCSQHIHGVQCRPVK